MVHVEFSAQKYQMFIKFREFRGSQCSIITGFTSPFDIHAYCLTILPSVTLLRCAENLVVPDALHYLALVAVVLADDQWALTQARGARHASGALWSFLSLSEGLRTLLAKICKRERCWWVRGSAYVAAGGSYSIRAEDLRRRPCSAARPTVPAGRLPWTASAASPSPPLPLTRLVHLLS